jgi:hypothetical protein
MVLLATPALVPGVRVPANAGVSAGTVSPVHAVPAPSPQARTQHVFRVLPNISAFILNMVVEQQALGKV